MKTILFERWHGSIQVCGISKQYAHFCNFKAYPKIKNVHLGCRDPLRVKQTMARERQLLVKDGWIGVEQLQVDNMCTRVR